MMKNTDEIKYLLEEVKAIARSAATEILAVYNTDFDVERKDDKSPLTLADLASHRLICERLQNLTPDIPVLSEESATTGFNVRREWHRFWLVDPLDGTREFIKRNGEFTVNIALIEDHEPVLGVIQIPVSGICYFATKGDGAFRQPEDETPARIRTRSTNSQSLAIAGSRSHGSEKQRAFIEKLGDVEIYAIGSSLKFCLVAEGKVDIYPRFGPTSEWDTAAAQCIVEEAGGVVTDEALNPLRYNTRESLLNPNFLVIADPSFDWLSIIQGLEVE